MMNKQHLQILYLGVPSGTSLQRYQALKKNGHSVTLVQHQPEKINFFLRLNEWCYQHTLPSLKFQIKVINQTILQTAFKKTWDVLWIDKGNYVSSQTIKRIKQQFPAIKVIGYSPDYMEMRHNNSLLFIEHSKYYDLFVTTKSYAVQWHQKIGVKRVLFQGNGYDPCTHRQHRISSKFKNKFGGAIGFIGTYENDRFSYLQYLGNQGLQVVIYGSDWERIQKTNSNVLIMRRAIEGKNYGKTICSFDINLCFLRKMNFDLQTQRSIEIPACGAFMLGERTQEHLSLFQEGKEAEFFETKEELVDKCKFYLKHESLRKKIAQAGRMRCIKSKYSYPERMQEILMIGLQ